MVRQKAPNGQLLMRRMLWAWSRVKQLAPISSVELPAGSVGSLECNCAIQSFNSV